MTAQDEMRAWLDEVERYLRNSRRCAPFVIPPEALTDVLDRADRLLALARCGAELAEAVRDKIQSSEADGGLCTTDGLCGPLKRWDAAAGEAK